MLKYLTGQLYAPDDGTGNPPPSDPPPAAHPVAAPWATIDGTWNLGEGEAAKPWWDSIAEEPVREHIKAKAYANPAQLAMANYNLTKMQRGADDVLSLPAKDAPPEAWNAFYTKLGRPEAADKYELKFADGVTVDDGMVNFGKNLAFELGLPPDKAQLMADKWNEFAAKANGDNVAATQAANTQAITALEQKWGADLEANRAAGERVMRALNLSEATMDAIQGNIGAAPLIELLAMIGRKSDEGSFINNGKGDPNNPATMSKDEAQAKINQLNGDPAFQAKYSDKNHAEHTSAVNLMLQLMQRTTGP